MARLAYNEKRLDAARRLADEPGVIRLGVFFRDDERPRYEETRHVPAHTAPEKLELLTQREREVLQQFAGFPRVREVALKLDISPHTVRSHLKSVYRKLEISSQTELLRMISA